MVPITPRRPVSDRVSSGTLRALRVLLGAREKREGKSARCNFFQKNSLFFHPYIGIPEKYVDKTGKMGM